MGTVIYSASPLLAFMSSFITILLTGGLGLAGLVAAFFQRKQGKGARIAMAVCGVFLLIVAFITSAFTFISMSSGTETVAVRLNDKNIATASCGDNGGTCTDYVLETTAGQVSYDFVVNPQAYELAQLNTCYQVTFYKNKSLLNVTADADTYHHIESITRIEVADPAACP